MSHRGSRLRSEGGNAVLDFVAFYAVGLFLILTLSANFESELRSRMAALTMANEALRVWQMSGQAQEAKNAAAQTALAFLVDQDEWTITVNDACSSSKLRKVEARVGRVIEVAQGDC